MTPKTDRPAEYELLAKPPKGTRKGRTVVEHTRDVIEAFRALFCDVARSVLVESWMRFFRLDDKEAFLANGLAAAACHDWGKANDGFQAMLLRKGRQLLRHERVSALLMNHPSVWNWLSRNRSLDLPVVLAAVVGHHLKARQNDFLQAEGAIEAGLRVYWENESLQEYLAGEVAEALGLGSPLFGDVPERWSYEPRAEMANLLDALEEVRDRLEQLGDELERDEPRRRLLWAVRSALIAADSAGSGLFRTGEDAPRWIAAAFGTDRLDGPRIWRAVIDPRTEEVVARRGGGSDFPWNDFQTACGDARQVPDRALLLAPCGSGKTLAAWRWIAARCDERPRGRVIFLYPTRGTATEGYRDYVGHAGPEEAALVHGTADLDIDDIHPDLDDERRINEARLFAMRQWPKRYFSATVDQFLGFLQHGYGPTCHLPLLTDSVVVVDEVHSYDRGMFSALLEFLRHFCVPVLCMTATLQERRRWDLEACGLKVVEGLGFGGEAGLLQVIASYPRYRVARVRDASEAEDRVRVALAEGKRVLWVVNTVDRAQALARRFIVDPEAPDLRTLEGIPVFCYHSRYRLADRKAQHQQVVGSFRGGSGVARPVLAVTTQVCEMSLDLDADLLVTEYAPASSLVQRMGRCCRDTEAHETGRVGDVIFYSPGDRPEDRLPYTRQDLEGVEEFVAKLVSAGRVSQVSLEDRLTEIPHVGDLPKECRFVESGPWASAGEENFRDIEDRNRQALLPGEDVEKYLRLRDGRKSWEAQALILTLPRNYFDPVRDDRLPSWLGVAKGGCYRPAMGYGERGRAPGPTIV